MGVESTTTNSDEKPATVARAPESGAQPERATDERERETPFGPPGSEKESEFPEIDMETVPFTEPRGKKPKKPLDNNIYSTKKTVAQGMMDIALLTANSTQLKLIIKHTENKNALFFIHVSCISISIILQVIVGVLLIINSRYNINQPHHHSRADLMNNLTVVGIFLITVVNVIASSFGDTR